MRGAWAARVGLAALRLRDTLLDATLRVCERVLPALPRGLVLALADGLGLLAWALDRRGRGVGRANLEAVFGATHGKRWRARVLRRSYRHAVRTLLLLFHLQPMTPALFARLVRIEPGDLARFRAWAEEGRRGVLVSAHLGNWELLLAARTGVTFTPPFAYLAESTGVRVVDDALDRLRDRGAGSGSLRKRGALALRQAFRQGKCISFMMDRNLRGSQGGVYVPFLGLEARTTPLGAVLAQAFGAPMGVSLMEPDGPGRWRLTISDDVMPVPGPDPQADVRLALTRANNLLSEAVRRHPEAYLWMLKRFKSRPCVERGPYPEYSFYDP